MEGISSQVATTDYLTLLTIQLQNQDPIDPVDQEGLIQDLAQFSTLEGIENLNTSFESMLQLQEMTQGVNLVGKEIQFLDPATEEIKSGRVDELFTLSDEIRLMVNGESTALENVISVAAG